MGRLQGQRWAGTGAGGSLEGVGVETQLQNFFWAALQGPCWFIHLVVRGVEGKLARAKTWAVYQCNLRSSWCFHSLLLVLCAQADANTHTCVAFVKHAEMCCQQQITHSAFYFASCIQLLPGNLVWLIICAVSISNNSVWGTSANVCKSEARNVHILKKNAWQEKRNQQQMGAADSLIGAQDFVEI